MVSPRLTGELALELMVKPGVDTGVVIEEDEDEVVVADEEVVVRFWAKRRCEVWTNALHGSSDDPLGVAGSLMLPALSILDEIEHKSSPPLLL